MKHFMLFMIEAHTVVREEMSPHQNHLYYGSKDTDLVMVTAFCRYTFSKYQSTVIWHNQLYCVITCAQCPVLLGILTKGPQAGYMTPEKLVCVNPGLRTWGFQPINRRLWASGTCTMNSNQTGFWSQVYDFKQLLQVSLNLSFLICKIVTLISVLLLH